MNERLLGRTGIKVSEVAFGGVEIGIPYGIGVKTAADMLSKKGATRLLQKAFDSGINFFDTARIYGRSEEIMGDAFKGFRNEVIIATKCRHLRDEHGELPESSNLKELIKASLAESLKSLQTDYVDIFMLHQTDLELLRNDEISSVFLEAKKEGKTRFTGASTYTTKETRTAIESGNWDIIQLPFNLMDQSQETSFSLAEKENVGIVIRSVLMKGLLSDRGKGLHPALEGVERHIKNFDELLENVSYDLATLAIKFALSFPSVSSILVGIDRLDYLNKSLEAANGIYLDDKKLARAKQLSYPDPAFLNLPYWHKMNWLT